MRLSLNTILFSMREFRPQYDPGFTAGREADTMKFCPETPDFQENCIYLCTAAQLKTASGWPQNIVFFGVGTNTGKIVDLKKNIILFTGADTIQDLLEAYLQITGRLSDWERKLHQALLYNCTAAELLSIASEEITSPILLSDSGFNVMEFRNNPVGAVGIKVSSRLGYTPPEYMAVIRERHLLTQVEQSRNAVVQPAISTSNTYNIYRCHRVNGKIAGYSTLFCGEEKPAEGYVDLCELYFQVVDLFLKITRRSDQLQTYMYESLLSALMQNENPLEQQLSKRLKYVGLPEEAIFTLVKFVFGRETNYNPYLCGLLQKYFPEKYFFLYQGSVYYLNIVRNSEREYSGGPSAASRARKTGESHELYYHKEHLGQVLNQIEQQLGKSHAMVSLISNPFYSLSDLYYAGMQCMELEQTVFSGIRNNNRAGQAVLTDEQNDSTPKAKAGSLPAQSSGLAAASGNSTAPEADSRLDSRGGQPGTAGHPSAGADAQPWITGTQHLFFEDYLLKNFAFHWNKKYNGRLVTLPLYTQISDYDGAHGTEFLKTLKVYLACGGSLTRTAEELGLHRNSVVKRVHKMEELFHISPEDMDVRLQLLYSFALEEVRGDTQSEK